MGAKIAMVASGKGGTGKSTISVFISAELAALGYKVLLIELDSGLRSIDIISGVFGETVYDISDILSGRCEPSKAIVQSLLYPGLSVVSAPYTGGHVDPEGLAALCRAMKPAFDYIIIDTAAGLGAPFAAAGLVAQLALLVVTPDKVCLRDGRIVADELEPRVPCRLIINKVPIQRMAKAPIQDLDECIDTVAAQLIGVIPESEEISVAAASGKALGASSMEKRIFGAIARRVAGEYVSLIVK